MVLAWKCLSQPCCCACKPTSHNRHWTINAISRMMSNRSGLLVRLWRKPKPYAGLLRSRKVSSICIRLAYRFTSCFGLRDSGGKLLANTQGSFADCWVRFCRWMVAISPRWTLICTPLRFATIKREMAIDRVSFGQSLTTQALRLTVGQVMCTSNCTPIFSANICKLNCTANTA